MRLFIGLEVEEGVRRELLAEIAHLHRRFPKVRWVRPENLHVTVRFLGEVGENEIEPISTAMDLAAESTPAFNLDVENLLIFPRPERPRIIAAGTALGSDSACRLESTLQSSLATLDFSPEKRRYTPHITLGRVKQPGHARGVERELEDAPTIQFGCMDVAEMVLYMSELGRGGAEYTPIYRAALS
ncbi:MAG: RNA 2',3'-cyclic phosphodiesterase [Planctomycetota bacterium]|jgi:2'-5' RNA ligase